MLLFQQKQTNYVTDSLLDIGLALRRHWSAPVGVAPSKEQGTAGDCYI